MRMKKTHIWHLQNEWEWVILYDDKTSMVNEYIFIMGSPQTQMIGFIWEALNIQRYDLSLLDAPFTDEQNLEVYLSDNVGQAVLGGWLHWNLF